MMYVGVVDIKERILMTRITYSVLKGKQRMPSVDGLNLDDCIFFGWNTLRCQILV
jgi:hypothetical protein